MSNVIKAYSIRYQGKTKKTINTHFRVDKELDEKRKTAVQAALAQTDNNFVEGLKAVVIDPLPSTKEQSEKASKILENARSEAQNILEKAEKDAAAMQDEAYEAAQKKGFEEGMLQSRRELKKLKADFEEKSLKLKKEYEEMTAALEPRIADIIASLVEKITGIVIEDRDEVILYLADKALKNLEKCEKYTIRVSKEDYEYISIHKDILLGAVGKEARLSIVQDANLQKNQCLIETEQKVINCSMGVQLRNLLMDLKLIAGI